MRMALDSDNISLLSSNFYMKKKVYLPLRWDTGEETPCHEEQTAWYPVTRDTYSERNKA